MEKIVETKNLTHVYSAGTPFQRAALTGVDFHAYEGEYLGIIGHTGSGKSTLIQHLNGLLKPTSGQVLYKGQDIWSDPKLTRMTRFNVGLVFQYPSISSLRRPSIRTSPSAPRTWGWMSGRSTAGCGRPPISWVCGTTSWKSPPLNCPAVRSAGWPLPA